MIGDRLYVKAVVSITYNGLSNSNTAYAREEEKKGEWMLAGMEFRNGDRLLYIGIAKNEMGFKELNDFMTEANRRGAPVPARAPEFNEVFVIYPYGKFDGQIRENEYLGTGLRMSTASGWIRPCL